MYERLDRSPSVQHPPPRRPPRDGRASAVQFDSEQRSGNARIKKTQKESDIALLVIDEFEKVMHRQAQSKAAKNRYAWPHPSTTSSYSAETDLANANREMDQFLAEHEALYGEYNGLCKTTRRDHVFIKKSPQRFQRSVCAAKKRIEEMRENGDRPDLVRFMDEIEWRMNRIKQCESACRRL